MGARPEIIKYTVTRPGKDINKTLQIVRTTDTDWAHDVFMSMDDKYLNLVLKKEGGAYDTDTCAGCDHTLEEHESDSEIGKCWHGSGNGNTCPCPLGFVHSDRGTVWEEFVMDNYDGGRGEGVVLWVIGWENGDDFAVVGGWPLAEEIVTNMGAVKA